MIFFFVVCFLPCFQRKKIEEEIKNRKKKPIHSTAILYRRRKTSKCLSQVVGTKSFAIQMVAEETESRHQTSPGTKSLVSPKLAAGRKVTRNTNISCENKIHHVSRIGRKSNTIAIPKWIGGTKSLVTKKISQGNQIRSDPKIGPRNNICSDPKSGR